MQLTIQGEITLQSRDTMMLVMSKVNSEQSVPLWQTRLITLKTHLLLSSSYHKYWINGIVSWKDCSVLIGLVSMHKLDTTGNTSKNNSTVVLDFLPRLVARGQGATVLNWKKVGLDYILWRHPWPWGWWGTRTCCPGKLWMLQPWYCSRPGWTKFWATWSSERHPCPWLWVGTGWSLSSLPSQPILCYFSVSPLFSDENEQQGCSLTACRSV